MKKIDVIMPARNASKYLRCAIDSILNQTYENFRLIIVDDASTDNTVKIIKSYLDNRIFLIKNRSQMGVAKSLNIALNYVNSEYIARMDADDVAKSNRLQTQLDYLINHKDVGVVASAADLINENGKICGIKQYSSNEVDTCNQLINRNVIIHPTVMFRTQLINKYGLYDENLNGAEDYDLWLRLGKHTKIINLPQKLLKYRIHTDNVSNYAIKKVERATIKTQIKALIKYNYNLLKVKTTFCV